jgi:L-ascorbate metabolism protein UlaG (beta-lactamase superfamily)
LTVVTDANIEPIELPAVHFRWLGVAGLELTSGRQTLLVDPFLTRPPFRRLWLGRVKPDHDLIAAHIPRGEHILVSHAHYDHLMDVPDIARRTGAQVYGSSNTCALLEACRLPASQIHMIQAGDQLDLGEFSVEVLAATHGWAPGYTTGKVRQGLQPPLRLREYVLGEYNSFLMQVPGLRLLNWCGVDLRAAPQAEVLFTLPTARPGFIEALLSAVQPRLVIPVHWDDLFRPLSEPIRPYFELPRRGWPPLQRIHLQRFKERVKRVAAGVQVLIPQLFESYDLSKLLLTVQ